MSPNHPNDTDWTPALIARLTELHADGSLRYADIADMLAQEFKVTLSKNGVVGKVHRLGLVKRPRGYKPKPKPKPKPAEPEIEPEVVTAKVNRNWRVDLPVAAGARISIWQLESGRCHFPHGQRPPYEYCGAPAPGGPYCRSHMRVVYGPRR